MYKAIRVVNGISEYSLRDINDYGVPDLYGIFRYIVIDDPTESCPFVLDYKGEQERRGALRPIHRYSEDKRFESLIKKFLGGVYNFDFEMLITISIEYDLHVDRVWNSVRKILKDNGWKKMYDYIPGILESIGYPYKIRCDKEYVVGEILNDFKKLVAGFHESDFGYRKYMINYRFIALKLMDRHGVVFEYMVPKLQTGRKIKEFEDIWQKLSKFLD
jgi:hypothetical protein